MLATSAWPALPMKSARSFTNSRRPVRRRSSSPPCSDPSTTSTATWIASSPRLLRTLRIPPGNASRVRDDDVVYRHEVVHGIRVVESQRNKQVVKAIALQNDSEFRIEELERPGLRVVLNFDVNHGFL